LILLQPIQTCGQHLVLVAQVRHGVFRLAGSGGAFSPNGKEST